MRHHADKKGAWPERIQTTLPYLQHSVGAAGESSLAGD